jgi:hypothetical protein
MYLVYVHGVWRNGGKMCSVSGNKWKCIFESRKKADAISISEKQVVHSCVMRRSGTKAEFDNGLPPFEMKSYTDYSFGEV